MNLILNNHLQDFKNIVMPKCDLRQEKSELAKSVIYHENWWFQELCNQCIPVSSSKILIFNSLQLWLLPFLLIEIQTTWKSSLSGESNQEEGSKEESAWCHFTTLCRSKQNFWSSKLKAHFPLLVPKCMPSLPSCWPSLNGTRGLQNVNKNQPTTMIKLPITVL